MKSVWRAFVLANLLLVSGALPMTTQAVTIEYEVADLTDTTEGEDLWQYTYRVSDRIFNTGHGFTIHFEQTSYGNIEETPPPVNEDWDITVWQPDSAIPDAGAYDALSVTSKVEGASLTDAFTVTFVWLGEGAPGPQSFEVYQEQPFNILESGQTVSGQTQPWDVNGDQQVDIFDLVLVAGEFGKTPPDNPAADVDSNGTVDVFDLVQVAIHFGETYDSPTAAPGASSLTGPAIAMKMVAQSTDEKHVTIQIHAHPSTMLAGFQLALSFDPKQLSLVKVVEGDFFAAQGHQSYWLPPKMTNSRLQLASVALHTGAGRALTDGVSTVLAQATFQTGEDANTAMQSIRLENVSFADSAGRAILVNVPHHVEIRPPSPITIRQNTLFQNFPNPFNPETWIPYQLSTNAVVTIHIYNAQGHLIRSLAPGFRSAGRYTERAAAAYWDGRNQSGESISSGLYYYTIHAGDFTATRKMLVVK